MTYKPTLYGCIMSNKNSIVFIGKGKCCHGGVRTKNKRVREGERDGGGMGRVGMKKSKKSNQERERERDFDFREK